MADNVATQTAALATIPTTTTIATIETAADGHVQRTMIGGGSTCTTTAVGDAVTSAQMLAANVDRLGATLYNDSRAIAYVKFGTTASTSDFNVAMGPGSYLEVPFGYRGRIDAIWSADAGGNMRIGEFT